MILDDPIAMYLNEGGMINPGFRLRNPQMVQEEVPQPNLGIPDIPLEAQAEDLPNYRTSTSRYVPNPYVDGGGRGAEIGSVEDSVQQTPYANTVPSTTYNPNSTVSNYNYGYQTQAPGTSVGGVPGNFDYGSSFSNEIPKQDEGQISFGNTSFIGR
jgi:hypothetical protein